MCFADMQPLEKVGQLYLWYLIQQRCYEIVVNTMEMLYNSCLNMADSTFGFRNFLEFKKYIFSSQCGLNLWCSTEGQLYSKVSTAVMGFVRDWLEMYSLKFKE